MGRVVLDAGPLIAFLDCADVRHARAVAGLRERLTAGDEILVAASTYAEILVRPSKLGTDGTVEEFIAAVGARIIPIDRGLAGMAARLRANHPAVRLPDAMCLAAAIDAQASLLTFDRWLERLARRVLASRWGSI